MHYSSYTYMDWVRQAPPGHAWAIGQSGTKEMLRRMGATVTETVKFAPGEVACCRPGTQVVLVNASGYRTPLDIVGTGHGHLDTVWDSHRWPGYGGNPTLEFTSTGGEQRLLDRTAIWLHGLGL